ncbi:MAG: putative oxidoreductase [Pseudonocardiales bacterium]|nr:putative oxidoreductase [Pseudonocardiales bacterium]
MRTYTYAHIVGKVHAMRQISYWLDSAPAGVDYTSAAIPRQVDIAVIGGGLTGLSAAVHLADTGATVAVLEQHKLGWGASGRNGGMCTTGMAIGLLEAIRRYGVEAARGLYGQYDAAINLVEKLVAEEGIDCDFRRSGKLTLASKPAHYDRLRETHSALAEIGYEATLVPRDGLSAEIGSDTYWGGLVDPLGAGLHVGKFVRGLAGAADRRGVQLIEDATVTAVSRVSGQVHDVRSSRGTVRASQVLLATSGYSGRAVPRYRRRIVPIGSFVIVTEPLPRELIDELMPTRRMAADTKNLLFYFRITPDDRMLFGGRARFALSNPESDLKSGRILQRGMASVFPALAGSRVDYTWGGLVDMTRDQLPHAGEHDGHFYSMGYSGHGVQMATYMGSQMAAVMSGDPSANPWREFPWPAIPGHLGRPWFLPFVGAYYRMKDRIS